MWLVVARSWFLSFFVLKNCLNFLVFFRWRHPFDSSMRILMCGSYFVITRPYAVFLVTSVSFLGIFLSDQLAPNFLISKNVIVRWYRGWIGHQHLLLVLFSPHIAWVPFWFPFLLFIILAWTWDCFRLLVGLAIFKTLNPGCERVMRLYQLDAELVETELLQRLCALHRSIDVVESFSRIVSSWAY